MSRSAPPGFGAEIFDLTMKGLEIGLKVGDIATYGFVSCDVDEDAREVIERPQHAPYDCIPVKDRDRVVGVLERNGEIVTGVAREAMRRLDDGLLVSADEPLRAFIPLLVDTPHRLVVRGARIEGIVTSSDIHKLPVRLLAFALVTHLEMTMAEAIVRRSTGDEWIMSLGPGRQQRIAEKFEQLRAENFDPPLIEVTDFCDKREVLARMGVLDVPSKTKAIGDFKKIEELRNSVAHAATYAQTDSQLAAFVELLARTEAWIGRLSLPPAASSGG